MPTGDFMRFIKANCKNFMIDMKMARIYWAFLPFHRAFAAFCADRLRCAAVILAALALPPTKPPFLPSAAAASFFAGGVGSWALPVANATICAAHWFTSRGRFGCFAISPLKDGAPARQAHI